MRSCLTAALATALLPCWAVADMVTPGFSSVPRHLVLEAENTPPGYQFWLVSRRGVEPLAIAPGHSCQIDGTGRGGSYRLAYVVAVPNAVAEQLPAAGLAEVVLSGKLPPGVLRSESIDFSQAVPFYDSRRAVIDTYRLELVPGERVSLVWVGQNAGSVWVKLSWALAGLFAVAGLVWGGYRLFRRKPSPT